VLAALDSLGMPLPEDVPDLLRGESDRVEWKESGRAGRLLEAVCAMANDLGDTKRPGYVVLGVDNAGTVRGVDSDGGLDEQQQALASLVRSSKIQPVPSVDVATRTVAGKTVIVVRVEPYAVPPVVEVDGRAWVRIGTTTQRANQADLQRLSERRPQNRWPFDTRPVVGISLADLELGPLRAQYEADRDIDGDMATFPAFDAWLAQHQFGVVQTDQFVPNAASVLVLGKSPQDTVPAAWLDLVRYGGPDHDASILNRRPATGTVIDQLEVGWAWLAAQIETRPEQEAGIRMGFVPDYPEEALKELLRNLVQHRLYEGTNAPGRVEWFEDRVEFSNPGGPFMRAAEGEFGTHSEYRNPLLTRRLVAAGYVQQLGRGVRRARLQLERNGNPPLEVVTDGFTRLVVRRRP
jgi:ATP-dependent DNA helicase RecG